MMLTGERAARAARSHDDDSRLLPIAIPAILGVFTEAFLGATPPGYGAATFDPYGPFALTGYAASAVVALVMTALWLWRR